MRSGSAVLLVVAALLGACSAPSSSGSPTEVDNAAVTEEVMETLAGLTEAMNAHDPERIFAFYRQDPSFRYVGCTSTLFGWDSFSPRIGSYYSTLAPDVTFQQEVLNVQVLGPDVAVATLRGSSTEAEALFWTEVLQRTQDGRWLITYEHESWPDCRTPQGPHMGTEGMEVGEGGEPGAGA